MIRRLLIPLILVVFFIVQPLLTGLYTDFLWFGELGYRSVFMTMLLAQVQLFLIAGAAFFTIIFLTGFAKNHTGNPITTTKYKIIYNPGFDKKLINFFKHRFSSSEAGGT